ncbi:hypothetical protein RHMOL_Rhmol06G0127800 [Rhododendron molle]|uniref:Uncharacterized protein n=1 Tax=Rhododendron molle TaxID=49168 RepID=A0ACC0NCG5_RHOML|nr:hypothetical protein RHMOL_Rhmol06G0127800 [Rhododendron molle]
MSVFGAARVRRCCWDWWLSGGVCFGLRSSFGWKMIGLRLPWSGGVPIFILFRPILAMLICLGFELWISLDPLLSRRRLVLMYPRYRGACYGSRCLRSMFRFLWFFPVCSEI